MITNSYYGSHQHIALCKRNGFAKRIVRDLAWFMRRVNKDGPVPVKFPELGSCWEWTRALVLGYGYFQIVREGGKQITRWKAHRYSWVLHCGEISDGLWVLHKCDNTKCVRPEHLFLGNNQQNQRDSHNKDRGHYKAGERHPRATISNETARRVKEMLRDGLGATEISRRLSLKVYTVENIKFGQSFAWLTI